MEKEKTPKEVQEKKQKSQQELIDQGNKPVPWYGYVSLIFAIVFFSGIFATMQGWITAFDYTTLLGKYGAVQGAKGATTFLGTGGEGARYGFIFGLSLAPCVMLALGVVECVTQLQGLRAAQKLLTPLLRPLLGIPGIAGLALISSMQSTDAGAVMMRDLHDEGYMTDRERLNFAAFQLSADGTITNYLGTGSALFAMMSVPILYPLIVIFVFKIIGTNLMRLYLKRFSEEELKG